MLNWPRSEDLQGSRWGGFIRFVKFLIEFGVQCHSLSDHAAWTIIKTSAPIPHALGRRWPPHFPPPPPPAWLHRPRAAKRPCGPVGSPSQATQHTLPALDPQTNLAKSRRPSVCLQLVGCLDLLFVCSPFLFFFFYFLNS